MSPFKVPYIITQDYFNNSSRYASGRHSATDMVPVPKGPEPMYPLLPGTVIDKARGYVAINSKLPDDLISFFKSKNLIPKNHTGEVYLKQGYTHCLDVPVNVGQSVTTDTIIAHCGNIGMVYSGGVPVPPDQQGKPPYPGLHLHLDCVLHPNDTSHPFNLDKDVIGRIDPELLLNYKATMIKRFYIKDGAKVGVIVLEGFTFGGGFAKDVDALKKLESAFEFTGSEPTISTPQ